MSVQSTIVTELYQPRSKFYFSATRGKVFTISQMNDFHLRNAIHSKENKAIGMKLRLRNNDPVAYNKIKDLDLYNLTATLCPQYIDLVEEKERRANQTNTNMSEVSQETVQQVSTIQPNNIEEEVTSKINKQASTPGIKEMLGRFTSFLESFCRNVSREPGSGVTMVSSSDISHLEDLRDQLKNQISSLESLVQVTQTQGEPLSADTPVDTLTFSASDTANSRLVSSMRRRGIVTLQDLSTISLGDFTLFKNSEVEPARNAYNFLRRAGLNFFFTHKWLNTEASWPVKKPRKSRQTDTAFFSQIKLSLALVTDSLAEDKVKWNEYIRPIFNKIKSRVQDRALFITNYLFKNRFPGVSSEEESTRNPAIERALRNSDLYTPFTYNAVRIRANNNFRALTIG